MQSSWIIASTVALMVCAIAWCHAEDAAADRLPPTHVVVKKAVDPIVIDGKLEEESWKQAESLPVDVIHAKGVRTEPAGHCKITWDDEAVYIAFDVIDDDVRAQGRNHDKANIVPPNDVIEIFIDVNNDPEHFIELHLNPLNAFNDIFIIRPRKESPLNQRTRWGLMFLNGWDLDNYQTAVQVHGTVNDNEKPDKGWTAELRLPFKSLMLPVNQQKPEIGDTWRVQLVIQNGGAENRYIAWSPTYEAWFHHSIETWGRVEFGE